MNLFVRLIPLLTSLILAIVMVVMPCLVGVDSVVMAQTTSSKETAEQATPDAGPSPEEMEKIAKM